MLRENDSHVKGDEFHKVRQKWRHALSDPREIIHSLMDTYPGERNLGYADLTTAKWETEDVVSVLYKQRKTWLTSWFDVTITRVKICRHNNWKSLCRDCSYRLTETLEYTIAHAPKSAAEFATKPPTKRKRPGGENL